MKRITLAFCLALAAAAHGADDRALLDLLDAPLLFAKRFNYLGIHIYDTYYKWRPGGGIYVLENPADPPEKHRVRPVIDANTPGSLGNGIYSEPELSWDAERLLFCYKPTAGGSTSIYEIGVDGSGLRRLTDPTPYCASYKGGHSGHHDVGPVYLPDGRILFTSTRRNGLVPCANIGVDILHIMDADGSNVHAISVNNVNEFDPSILSDGRILHGRWEYVDKTALTQQSLWTIFPDGSGETALFANNLVHPEALLDPRPVPGAPNLVVATFTPHNAPPRGTVAFVDMHRGKNDLDAITNLDTPDNPTHDRGNSCEPWPLSRDVILFSGNAKGQKLNCIVLADRHGNRSLVYADPAIDCHSPMLVKPRPMPPVAARIAEPKERTGRFFVQDIYKGLTGVKRGDVKWLRVIEETSRTGPTHGSAYNQTFVLSAALAFSVKNFLGVVPVELDGSAFFEAPSGRALYLHALDAEGRIVQSMRTFVQATPGVTRSCIGCHEHKYSTPSNMGDRMAHLREPSKLQPESWGSGFVDFPSMVQPILDRHCVSCHGGDKGFGGGLDLSGGWTEHFNISYENLVSRRETQLTAYLISGIDCMNGTANWSAQIFPPRSHGSGNAPLADVLVSGHKDRIPDLTRTERDTILAWIDTNGLYYGTWDYSPNGSRLGAWVDTRNALIGQMQAAGCAKCHGDRQKITLFENDWFNLRSPEHSRLLRAPLPKGKDGGLGLCRDRKTDPKQQRIRLLADGMYYHAVLPLDKFPRRKLAPHSDEGEAVVSFASAGDPNYQAMLDAIRKGRIQALAKPRVDMPDAPVLAGDWRRLLPTPLPDALPDLKAAVDGDSIVRLSWERSARTLGLSAELYRGPKPDFPLGDDTRIADTRLFQFADAKAEPGPQHYALVLLSAEGQSQPVRTTVTIPQPPPPPTPIGFEAVSAPGRVDLRWQPAEPKGLRYRVYRTAPGAAEPECLTVEPVLGTTFTDATAQEGVQHSYTVRALSRRGVESPPSHAMLAAPLPEVKDPLFTAPFATDLVAALYGGGTAPGKAHGQARVADGVLDLRAGGYVTFPNRPEFGLDAKLSVELWMHFTKEAQMPVVVGCGHWQQAGWFLQRIGGGWRWHVGGIDCDGGRPSADRWTHLVGTFDGRTARLFQDGKLVAEKARAIIRTPWRGPLHVGQYSGGPADSFQVFGHIAALKIYGRAQAEQDAAAAFQAGPPAGR